MSICQFVPKQSLAVGVLAVLLRGLVLYGVAVAAVGNHFLLYKSVLGDTYLQNAGQS